MQDVATKVANNLLENNFSKDIMLKKSNRLRKRYQFQYIYRSGKYISDKAVTLHYVTSKTKCVKVGFAVTKKIGHAVRRNLVRRRLREILRKYLSKLKPNYNIILVAKEQILETEFAKLETQVFNLLKRADLLKNDEENI